MAVLYTLCAGLLTFDNGPATYVGNHYFSAWAGFFISFAVFGSVLKEFLGVGGTTTAAAAASETTGGECILCSSQYGVVNFHSDLFFVLFSEPDIEMDRI